MQYGFSVHFPDDYEIEKLFHVLLSYLDAFAVKCLFQLFAYFNWSLFHYLIDFLNF
jgi:hypothetical protein